MTSNIRLGPGSVMRGCLIMRLDDSDYVITFADDAGDARVEDLITYTHVPSLWGWTKLWWKDLRRIRRERQGDVLAGIYVPQAIQLR